MRIDVVTKSFEVLDRRLTVQGDGAADREEPRPDRLIGPHEATQVNVTLEGHRDAVEGDPKVVGVEPVRDLLASGERGKCVLDRARGEVGTAQRQWLIDVK